MSKAVAPDAVKRLVETFDDHADWHKSPDYREARLRQENAAPGREVEGLIEPSAITRATCDQRLRLVAIGSRRLPVRTLGRLLRVQRSGYHAWQARCGQYRRRPRITERA